MSRFAWGCAIYGLPFFAAELPGHFWKHCPWPTLSGTFWIAVKWWPTIAYFIALTAFVLVGHLDMHWSVKWLIGVALLAGAAAAAHVVTR